MLPAAQFCNTLTHDVLQLWRARGVRPYVVHATWMRQQAEAATPCTTGCTPTHPACHRTHRRLHPHAPSLPPHASQAEAFKLMRLREATLWRDAPEWYLPPPPPAWGAAPIVSRNLRRAAAEPAAGFVTLRLSLPPELLRVPRIKRGALPLHHLRLMHHQLQQVVATPLSCTPSLHPSLHPFATHYSYTPYTRSCTPFATPFSYYAPCTRSCATASSSRGCSAARSSCPRRTARASDTYYGHIYY